ncbi:MAG: (Fe-S)-binding protein [Ardenticatenaceae bacterium]|nr:(Fe-S)-binding protein [Ardenticatenaceae bacterium]HBY92860.1 (Fe-S)-binding protein [Chloroflexota bacterium]
MLTSAERITFLLLAIMCGGLAGWGFYHIYRAVTRGHGQPDLALFRRRAVPVSLNILLQRTIFPARPLVGVFHALVFFAFTFYALVNILDAAEGFLGTSTLYHGGLPGLYNLIADLLSVGGLVGMAALLVRRFRLKPFQFNASVLLQRHVAGGIPRDSLIVGIFILVHVGSRWLGQALRIAEGGRLDLSQPTASLLSLAFGGLSEGALIFGIHATWWLALGLILLFLPYFVYSKHIHLMLAPLNWILREERPLGRLEPPTGNGQVGADRLQDLRWYQLLDAYACIMCNRCQDVCPAHGSGAALSPAAIEINKRYFLNRHLAAFADKRLDPPPLLEMAVSKEAVWSCTTCAACLRICPVGNRPLLDIVDIRRSLIQAGDTPDPNLQSTLESFGRQGNSFNKPSRQRAKWVKGLDFAIKDARQEPVEYLWFVGDFASYDPRMQENTRTVARLFHRIGLDFGILYDGERNAGNDVRRVGEEGLFEMLVEQNLKALGKAEYKTIVTTDPHSYNTLKNEYSDFGLQVPVYHYTELLDTLLASGRLKLGRQLNVAATYHDPCYLGRYNGVVDAPRRVLRALGVDLREMPRCRENTYCCGAGGGRIWMDSATGVRPSEQRIREAAALGAISFFVVACPKDMAMYSDAVKTTGHDGRIEVVDIARLVAEALQPVADRQPLASGPVRRPHSEG